MEPIVLEPAQLIQEEKIDRILQDGFFYLDTSPMGSGKTEVTLNEAKKYFGSILVICPKIMKGFWRSKCELYGIKCHAAISFESLRSIKGSQPKHGLLSRHDYQTVSNLSTGKWKKYFEPTKRLINLLKEGTLVVFDEVQLIKNDNDQFKACLAVARAAYEYGTSRLALLSATPYDKMECIMQLLHLTCTITMDRLISTHPRTKEITLEGLGEMVERCRNINERMTNTIVKKYTVNARNAKNICIDLYNVILKHQINVAMPPLEIKATKRMVNGFFKVESRGDFDQKIQDLIEAAEYDAVKQTINMKKLSGFAAMIPALRRIEMIKVPIFVKLAREKLESDPKSKVIIGMNYNDSLDELNRLLADYRPLSLRGEDSDSERDNNVRLFQTSPEFRLIICNIRVGSFGITLNDTVGDAPRFLLANPLPSLISLYQFIFRVWRYRTASDVNVIIVYVQGGEEELMIFDLIARKSDIVRSGICDEISQEIVFPGDFPRYEET